MRRRPVYLDVDAADVEAALAHVPSKPAKRWRRMSDRKRKQYFADLRRFGGDPPELLALLDDPAAARGWAEVPWLVQRDYCRYINAGRTRAERRWRARGTLRTVLDGSVRVSQAPPWSFWGRMAVAFGLFGVITAAELGWESIFLLGPAAVFGLRWLQLRRRHG